LQRLWVLATDCGDSAVTLPLAALALAVLVASRQRRLALWWLLTVLGCAAAIGALKVAFGGCGGRLGFLDIVSPSGHTAMSTAIYGSLALLIGTGLPQRGRHVMLAAAAMLIAAVAVSRIVLRFHGMAETATGLVVGLAAVGCFRSALRREAAPAVPVLWLALGGLAVVAVMHGTRWLIEPLVRDLAAVFRFGVPGCR